MPGHLAERLPSLTQKELDALYGSIADVRDYPYDHPIRQGVIRGALAYFFF